MNSKVNSIQYLRGIAALLVVYAHSLSFIGKGDSAQSNFYYLKTFGAIGVDLFFVISGFIIYIVSLNLKGKESVITFLQKRFIRINPSYYFASILALILRYISKPHIDFPVHETLKTITIVPILDYDKLPWKPILYIGWTLAFEWLFYTIFAILILFSVQKKFLLTVTILTALTILGYALPIENIQFQFITNPIIWEFGLGVLIGYIFKKDNLHPIFDKLALSFLISGILLYAIIIITGWGVYAESRSSLEPQINWHRLFIWGFPSAIIVFGAVLWERKHSRSFNNKVMLLLGDASFSIYLTHTMFISLINKLYLKISFIPLDLLVLISVLAGAMIGIVYYKHVEVNITKFFNNMILKKTKLIPKYR